MRAGRGARTAWLSLVALKSSRTNLRVDPLPARCTLPTRVLRSPDEINVEFGVSLQSQPFSLLFHLLTPLDRLAMGVGQRCVPACAHAHGYRLELVHFFLRLLRHSTSHVLTTVSTAVGSVVVATLLEPLCRCAVVGCVRIQDSWPCKASLEGAAGGGEASCPPLLGRRISPQARRLTGTYTGVVHPVRIPITYSLLVLFHPSSHSLQ